jgi:hypothetical protein
MDLLYIFPKYIIIYLGTRLHGYNRVPKKGPKLGSLVFGFFQLESVLQFPSSGPNFLVFFDTPSGWKIFL